MGICVVNGRVMVPVLYVNGSHMVWVLHWTALGIACGPSTGTWFARQWPYWPQAIFRQYPCHSLTVKPLFQYTSRPFNLASEAITLRFSSCKGLVKVP